MQNKAQIAITIGVILVLAIIALGLITFVVYSKFISRPEPGPAAVATMPKNPAVQARQELQRDTSVSEVARTETPASSALTDSAVAAGRSTPVLNSFLVIGWTIGAVILLVIYRWSLTRFADDEQLEIPAASGKKHSLSAAYRKGKNRPGLSRFIPFRSAWISCGGKGSSASLGFDSIGDNRILIIRKNRFGDITYGWANAAGKGADRKILVVNETIELPEFLTTIKYIRPE